jgi:predicted secreted protein
MPMAAAIGVQQRKEGFDMRYQRMGFWMVVPLIAGSLAMAATACNRSTMEEKVNPNVIVTQADHDKAVKVAKGGQVTVKLTWSPGTGYDWVITRIDPAMLRQEGEAGTEPAKEPMPGAAETRVFHFKALKPGTTALEFQSRRAFEKDAPSLGVFRVQVLISE